MSMLDANDCQLGEIYKDVNSEMRFIVVLRDGSKCFQVLGEEDTYTTQLNPKYHIRIQGEINENRKKMVYA